MLRNYLVIAFRNLMRQFSYSLINITGLAIGLACSLVIFLYVYGEWSYDRHHEKGDRIYRVGISFFNMGGFAVGPAALGEFLPKNFEGIEAFTRVSPDPKTLITHGDQSFSELAYGTDSSFFKIFTYHFIAGSPATALKSPHSIVLSQSMATKFFQDKDAMGQVLEIDKNKTPYTVTGIIEDDTHNSQFKSSIWLSVDDQLTHDLNWASASMYNYFLLKEQHSQADLENALDRLLEKEIYPKASTLGVPATLSFAEYKKHQNAIKFFVHPLKDIHLQSRLNFEISPGGNEANMYTFAAISLFILVLASVNFINLTTARASRRAKEVGIRKAVGSTRKMLVGQFLAESVIVSIIAMMLSLALAEIFLRGFELVTGSRLLNSIWQNQWNLLVVLACALVVGLLSGVYPAFYLTAFKPVKVLKGNTSASGGSGFRNLLVVGQFSISICLMICTAIIIRQMNFMQTKDLGFDQQNVITIENITKLGSQAEAFKNELTQQQGVTQVSLHSGEPGSKGIISMTALKSPELQEPLTINTIFADPAFTSLMHFQLVAGREFNKDLASDSSSVILNEAAVKVLGLKNPVGTELNKGQRVIGVVRDFHWESLRNRIAPSIVIPGKDYIQLSFRLRPEASASFIAAASAKWKQLVPDEPMKYHFLDDNFNEIMKKEQVLSKVISFFTALAILISCLGLYGLSAYTTEQRSKEISIRKILGASVSGIVGMLNRKFAVLVGISTFISLPVSAWVMQKWIQEFAYRTELAPEVFAVAVILAFLIAIITVSFHSIKAALVNPAETLKNE